MISYMFYEVLEVTKAVSEDVYRQKRIKYLVLAILSHFFCITEDGLA